MVVTAVPFSAVAPWKSRAAREHVAVTNTRNTRWFAAYRDSDAAQRQGAEGLLGFSGVIILRGSVGRIKGIWVRPEYRKLGAGRAVTQACIQEATECGCCLLEAISMHRRYWLGQGFYVAKATPAGVCTFRKNI
jgi:ribosomal protein S18 acetylase RimI-like enzyme